MSDRPRALAACSALLVVIAAAPPASAQDLQRFTADSVIAVDVFGGENVSNRPQMVIDASAGMRLGDRWQLFIRPWFRKARPSPTGATTPWDFQLYQAGARYERPGPVATRFEIGQIMSPIGLGILDWRPNLNPTIIPHLSYVVSMPSFDSTGPRVTPIAQIYPVGAQLTMSTLRWDARAALINASPTRTWSIGAEGSAKQTPVVVGGAGITPRVGLRLGASIAHGKYATGTETRFPSPGREMTLVGGEFEYAFAYTKLSGEMVRTAFETSTSTAMAYQYFVQGVQTLTPRVYVAARNEATSGPSAPTGAFAGRRTRMRMVETTAGFRLTPDVTLRSSYYARRSYNTLQWDNQVGVSLVWTHRWR